MKRKTVLRVLLCLAIGWLLYLSGCSLLGVSIEDRVMQFLADINNSDRGQVYLNFDPSISSYGGIQDPAFWDGHFPYGNAPYFVAALDTSVPTSVTFTLTDSNVGSWDVEMAMQQIGFDWFITTLWLDFVQVVFE